MLYPCRCPRKTTRQLRSHYSRVHFKEELKAYIDREGNCNICGSSTSSTSKMIDHIGVRHQVVESLIPQNISLKIRMVPI